MPEHAFVRDLGILLLFGFLGAWFAFRRGQSVIVGYILIGAVLGPQALGVIADVTLIQALSELGIILLMFFLGVEFSLERLKRVRAAVLLIGVGELMANLSVGFLVGSLLGWSPIERAFLAGIVAMSSSGVVAKLLIEWRRTANPEAEALMGIMIFEDFIAVLYLGVLSSFSGDGARASSLTLGFLKAIAFYALILGIGGRILPRALILALRVRSEELFVLLWLALILLAGVAASSFGLAPAAGAFLLGMSAPTRESELGERIYSRLEPFRDVFLALFFLAFGMMLDPQSLPRVFPLVAMIVPLSVLTELVITSSLAFLAGFSAPVALAVGAGMIPRGEYSLLYAALGKQLGLIHSDLFQFTGWYVFVMTLLAPAFMKNTRPLHRALRRIIPTPIAFAGTLVSATLRPMTMETSTHLLSKREQYLAAVSATAMLVLCLSAFALRPLWARALLLLLGGIIVAILSRAFRPALRHIEARVDRSRFSAPRADPQHAVEYTTHLLWSGVLVVLLMSVLWNDAGPWALALLPLFLLVQVGLAWRVYRNWSYPESPVERAGSGDPSDPPPSLAAH